MAFQRLSHIGICVSDLERSQRFYSQQLGFRERSTLEVEGAPIDQLLSLEGVKLQAVYLERDGTCIELLHFSQPGHQKGHQKPGTPHPMNQLGLTHLSLRVDDLSSTLGVLRAAGVNVLEATRIDNPALKSAAVFITDPDGMRIELVESASSLDALPGQ